MVDAEVDEFPDGVQVRNEHQRGVVEAVGQVHQFGEVRQCPRPAVTVGTGWGVRLQGVGAQLGQGLDLTDDLRGLGSQRRGPDDFQHAVDPAAGARGYGDPAAVGVVAPADGGQAGLRQTADPLAGSLAEPTPGHRHHARRHIAPARCLRSRESGTARQGERAVGAQRPDGHGFRAERRQRVFQQGVGHGLGVVRGQRAALGGPQPYGEGALSWRVGGVAVVRGLEEGGRHVGEPVARGLVDDLDGELEGCHTRLPGQLGELPGRL